jgi:hypothetical protein
MKKNNMTKENKDRTKVRNYNAQMGFEASVDCTSFFAKIFVLAKIA